MLIKSMHGFFKNIFAIDLYKRAFSIPSLLILLSLHIFEKSEFASLYFFNLKYDLPLSRKHLG